MNQSRIILFSLCFYIPLSLYSQLNKDVLNDTVETEVKAFGKSEEKNISTASVSVILGEAIRGVNTPNLGNRLSGRITGLNVSQTGGAPGYQDWPWLQIRGKASFLAGDGNAIKVVVDGFETKWHNIIPDEIESISVLKDAAAVCQYGVDGANGVLYIKTKRGVNRERNRITLNSRISLQQPTMLPKYVHNGEYVKLYNQAMISDGKEVSAGMFGNEYVVKYFAEGSYPYLFADVDWINQVTKPQTFAHDYSLSVNGGTNKVTYNVVLGYLNTQGIYAGTDSKRNINTNWDLRRYTIRTNVDVQVAKFLRSEISLRATVDDKQHPNVDEAILWKNMGVFIPFPVKTEIGTWGGSQGYPENPAASILAKGYNLENDRTIDANVKFIANLGGIAQGMEAFGQVVFSNNYFSFYNKTRAYAYDEYITSIALDGLVDYSTITRGDKDNNFKIAQPSGVQWNRYNLLAGLNYSNSFGKKHHIHASSMYLQELYRTVGKSMPWAKMGVSGRFNYNYAGKYIVEFAYALMGTSEYASGKRFGFFPAVSGAWILTDEEFLKHNRVIDFLKLSGSYGRSGNDNMGDGSRFTYKQYYMGSGNPYFLGDGFTNTIWPIKQGNVANPDITWEKSYKFNLALTGRVLKQFDFKLEYFNDYRTDIFVNPSGYMSALVGAEYYNQNAGIAQNSGFEAEATYQRKIGKFGYFVSGRFSYAKNKIIDMKETPKPENYLYLKGNPIDQPMALEAIGFFKDVQDIQSSPQQMFGVVLPGDVKYKDQNGDNVIDDNDRKPFGFPSYPRFYYGFDLGFDYHGFDFLLIVQGVGGRTVSLLSSGFMIPFINGGVKPHPELAKGYWTPERSHDARFPRLTTESNSNNYRYSTLWQIDGSYIRIKNIEIGYTFSMPAIKNISGFRLYVNMINPYTYSLLSRYNIDPEINSPFKYPLMKSVNCGFTLQF